MVAFFYLLTLGDFPPPRKLFFPKWIELTCLDDLQYGIEPLAVSFRLIGRGRHQNHYSIKAITLRYIFEL